jgi:hypothetical protein
MTIEVDPNPNRWASRKWALALLVVILSTGLLWGGRIDAGRWAEVVIWVVGLYMVGNTASAGIKNMQLGALGVTR